MKPSERIGQLMQKHQGLGIVDMRIAAIIDYLDEEDEPFTTEPCSCDESKALREQVRELELERSNLKEKLEEEHALAVENATFYKRQVLQNTELQEKHDHYEAVSKELSKSIEKLETECATVHQEKRLLKNSIREVLEEF